MEKISESLQNMSIIDVQMKFFREFTNKGYSQSDIAILWDCAMSGINPIQLGFRVCDCQLIAEFIDDLKGRKVDASYMNDKPIS